MSKLSINNVDLKDKRVLIRYERAFNCYSSQHMFLTSDRHLAWISTSLSRVVPLATHNVLWKLSQPSVMHLIKVQL
jgi:hypothetical protein